MGFQFMLILGLLGMYFDAAVVFVTKSSLLFKLAMAILCTESPDNERTSLLSVTKMPPLFLDNYLGSS